MRAFARLLDRLAFTPQRNGKLTLLRDYLRDAPDPERGWALAALTGALVVRRRQARLHPQGGRSADGSAAVRAVLRLSSAIWRRPWRWSGRRSPAPTASRNCRKWWRRLRSASRARSAATAGTLAGCARCRRPLGAAEAADRRPARRRVGAAGQAGAGAIWAVSTVAEIEEVWHGQHPPYEDLFAWLEKRSDKPSADAPAASAR